MADAVNPTPEATPAEPTPAAPAAPAAAAPEPTPAAPEGFDINQIPEQFRPEGKVDMAAFRLAYDEMASKQAQYDERTAALPKKPEDVVFKAPEDLTPYLPEGFEWPKGEDGNPLPLEIDDKSPMLDEFRKIAVAEGFSQKGIDHLRDLLVKDNVSRVVEAMNNAKEQKTALGPNGQSRIDTVNRTLQARLPANLAKAVADTITSADALRGLETLLSKGTTPTTAPGGRPDLSAMSPKERLAYGFEQRKRA